MRNLLLIATLAACACSEAGIGIEDDDDFVGETVFVTAVADVAGCESQGDEATAAIVDTVTRFALMVGDIAYEACTVQQFADSYHISWVILRDRTRPAPGNHEYETVRAAPYFEYFGALAGPSGHGYYSFDASA